MKSIYIVHVDDDEKLLSQYADDIFLTLDGSEKSLDESLTCFNKFFLYIWFKDELV